MCISALILARFTLLAVLKFTHILKGFSTAQEAC